MEFVEQKIKGAWLITPDVHGDDRGYFFEVYNAERYRPYIGDVTWLQDNESLSRYGVLRGLHYQSGEWSQAKLVRVTRGRVLDVIVDLRAGSPTFGQHISCLLSDENNRQLFIPRGMAHGFVVLSDVARFDYKVDNVYMPSAEVTLRYDDPALAIDWQLPAEHRILSAKDLRGISLADVIPF